MDKRLRSDAIFARLGFASSDADFELVACDRGGCQYLVDPEHLRVYLDPPDHASVVLNVEGARWPACRG